MNVKNVSELISNASEISIFYGPTSYLSNVIITTIFVVLFIFSFTGNLLIVATIKSNSHLQNISNSFIASLCLSDLISTVLCSPLWLYVETWGYNDWQWGKHLCKFYWVSEFATIYSKVLHVASFTAFRLVAVRNPFKTWDILRVKVVCYITSLWIFSTVFASPLAVFMNVRDISERQAAEDIRITPYSCSVAYEEGCCEKQFESYVYVISPILIFLPFTFIVVCSIKLIEKVIKQKKKFSDANKITVSDLASIQVKFKRIFSGNFDVINEDSSFSKSSEIVRITKKPSLLSQANSKLKNERALKRQKRISYQIGLVVFSFMLGYLPIAIHAMWSTITSDESLNGYWFRVASYLCLRFSECLNPLMYNLGSSKLRMETKEVLLKIKKTCFLNR